MRKTERKGQRAHCSPKLFTAVLDGRKSVNGTKEDQNEYKKKCFWRKTFFSLSTMKKWSRLHGEAEQPHTWKFSRCYRINLWAAWSDLIPDCVLSHKLNKRTPTTPCNLNYYFILLLYGTGYPTAVETRRL